MKNKTAIISTAGHIDHGKTALIRALTGFDCDTHKLEKERGITISLGFTRLDLDNGTRCGIIDCPGHHDFIHTMVAGSSGIDLALVTVAADEGIMPQTIEHLRIHDLLGVTNRIYVITRCDLVSKEIADALQYTLNSQFNAPVVQTSAVTGEGIEKLHGLIQCSLSDVKPQFLDTAFRMPIDRIFSIAGHGLVIGGTVRTGVLQRSDPIYLLPGEKKLRIRRMECFGESVDSVSAGQRTSINITGVKREDLHLGMQISCFAIPFTLRIDASIRLFEDAQELGIWSRVLFLQNGVRMPVSVHLLDRDTLASGHSGLAQIDFDSPHISLYGEQFVLRDSSDRTTIGGGFVLDPHPRHHRRRRRHQIESLLRLENGGVDELIRQKADGISGCFEAAQIAAENGLSLMSIIRHPDVISVNRKGFYLARSVLDRIEKRILDRLSISGGLSTVDLTDGRSEEEFALKVLQKSGRVQHSDGRWSLPVTQSEIDRACEAVLAYMLRENREIVVKEGMIREMARMDIDKHRLRIALDHLVKTDRVIRHEACYIHSFLLDRAIATAQRLACFSVRDFRDEMGCSRGTAIVLLEYLDSDGKTRREGDTRIFV